MRELTKEMLAGLLDGREVGDEINHEEELSAASNGLLVIFGYSDDNVELRGAINDEIGCYHGGDLFLHRKGALDVAGAEDCVNCRKRMISNKALCAKVELLWNKEKPYLWTYRIHAKYPHATFDIMEDGEKFCRGIVIDVKDLPVLA
jgi:hypothetical protein